MTHATLMAMTRWGFAAQSVGMIGKRTAMEDGWVVTYRTTPPGSPDAGRVAQVFISDDGMAMTRSDGTKRHEVEAITDTTVGRLEAAHRIREWLAVDA